jgi:glycosyltransferase involved in cell wall biosynthesis
VSRISVVIPVRVPAPYLGEALASVDADEVLVVDDGSGLPAGAAPGASLLRLPRVGRSVARNAGVEAAAHDVVAFLDADDLALPGRFERQRAALDGAALCFGRVEAMGPASELLPTDTERERRRFDRLLARGAGYEGLLEDCPIYTSATMVRRESFLAVGGYDPRLDAYEDLDLYLRLARRDRLVPCLGGPVSRHRRHPGNTSSDDLYAGALRLTEKHLPGAAGRSRRLLLERQVDCLWGLGDFRGARARAVRALAVEPRLLANRRLVKRLAASVLPAPALVALRTRRA